MKTSIGIIMLICFVVIAFSIKSLYAEPITHIEIQEWDDVYVITNGDNTIRIDCVPDEDTTRDVEGFCNIMWSTYFYGPDCDQECVIDNAMQDPNQHI
jgi:hypothetical protein